MSSINLIHGISKDMCWVCEWKRIGVINSSCASVSLPEADMTKRSSEVGHFTNIYSADLAQVVPEEGLSFSMFRETLTVIVWFIESKVCCATMEAVCRWRVPEDPIYESKQTIGLTDYDHICYHLFRDILGSTQVFQLIWMPALKERRANVLTIFRANHFKSLV